MLAKRTRTVTVRPGLDLARRRVIVRGASQNIIRTGAGDCQATIGPFACYLPQRVVELVRVKYVSRSFQSHVHSMHLSYRVASAGRGTGRDNPVDFSKILG